MNVDAVAASAGLFGLKGSVDAELSTYKQLVKDDIVRSKHIYCVGEQLIEYAAKGNKSVQHLYRMCVPLSSSDRSPYCICDH